MTAHTPRPARPAASPWAQLAAGLSLYLLLALAVAVYWPGVSGVFFFDDIPNLSPMGMIDHPVTLESALHFVLTGTSGPTGRPLSLASFLLDDVTWPAEVESFKRTNILLHALNGALVYWLGLTLARRLVAPEHFARAALVAGIAAGLWVLHPLNVSTTLYVVQRMTELAATFTLLGLIGYTCGRMLVADRPVAGYGLMSAGIGLGGVLGVLSKENAILLPLFALSIEILLRRGAGIPAPRGWRLWATVFLFAPIALLVLWIALTFDRSLSTYANRPFSLAERLLSEPRILWTYLRFILLPRQSGSTLFYDDYPVSTDLFSPPTTLAAIAGLLALVATAVACARRHPVVTFAIACFLGGHLLESTVLPLELYFEHRNYVPMIGPLYAIAHYAVLASVRLRRLTTTAALLAIPLLAFLTWQEARLWANPPLLAQIWADARPTSPRSQQFAADMWLKAGYRERARAIIVRLTENRPDHTSGWIQRFQLDCMTGRHPRDIDFDRLLEQLNTGQRDLAVIPSLQEVLRFHSRYGCREFDITHLITVTNALIDNEHMARSRSMLAGLHYVRAMMYAHAEHPRATIEDLRESFRINPVAEVAINEARILASLGRYNEALEAVDRARQVDQRGRFNRATMAAQIEELEALILEDLPTD